MAGADKFVANELEVFKKVAACIGDTLEAVCNMQEKEREELITVLGLKKVETNAAEKVEILDSDDEPLKDNHDNDNIFVEVDDYAELKGANARKRKIEEVVDVDEEEEGGSSSPQNTGWGECPMCEQLMRIPKLRLHSMACQGLHLNGGSGLEVNVMDMQSRCDTCKCLVPDLVFDEHQETCWAKTDNRRRISTPIEDRRKAAKTASAKGYHHMKR